MQRRRRRITWKEESGGDEEEDVVAELKCPVCLEFLVRPTILPCSHILCRDPCADRLFRSGFVRCPVCRDDSYVSGGIDSLPRVMTLERIIEKYSNRTVSTSSSSSCNYEVEIAGVGDVVCQLCSYIVKDTDKNTSTTTTTTSNNNNEEEDDEEEEEDIGPAVKAFKYCKHCNVAYCKPCLKTSHPDHPPFFTHLLVDPKKRVVEEQSTSRADVCLKHKKEKKKAENDDDNEGDDDDDVGGDDDDDEMYCLNCKEFVCRWCMLDLQRVGADDNDARKKESSTSSTNKTPSTGGGASKNDDGVDTICDITCDNNVDSNKGNNDGCNKGDKKDDENGAKDFSRHQDHDVIGVEEAAKLFMIKLRTQLDSLQGCFDSGSNQQKQLRSCMTSLQSNMAERKSKILNECDNLVNEVETKRQFFLSDLQFEERSKVTQMTDILERGKTKVTGLEKQVEKVKRLLEFHVRKQFITESAQFLDGNTQCFQATMSDDDPALTSLLTSLMTPVTSKVIDLRKERAVLRDISYLTLPTTPSIDVNSCFRSNTSVVLSLNRLTWEDVVVDGYVVYYSSHNTCKPETWTQLTFSTPNETRLMGRGAMKEGAICLMHNNLQSGTLYYFAVSAFNGCGSSEISEVVQCSTLSQSQTFVNAPSIQAERCRTFTYSAQLRTSIPLDDPDVSNRDQIELLNNTNNSNNNNHELSNENLPTIETTNIYTASTLKTTTQKTPQATTSQQTTSTNTNTTSESPNHGTTTNTTTPTNISTLSPPPHISTTTPTTLVTTITQSTTSTASLPTATEPLICPQNFHQTPKAPTPSSPHHTITHYLLYREASGRNKIWKSVTLYGKFDHRVFGLEPNTHYEMVIMSCDVVNRRCHVSNKVTLTTERSAY